MITGNIGEWSEIYTLFKIISDKQLYAGDSDLNKIENLVYPIIKILRKESDGTYEYSYSSELIIIKGSDEVFKIPIKKFQENAVSMLSKLKKAKGTFSIPEVETFMKSFNSKSIKAQSTRKSDIRIIIHDSITGIQPELGFSIKSQIGKASTLLNSSKATNFIFEINNVIFTENQIEEINSINTKKNKIINRVRKILDFEGNFKFVRPVNSTFENNLILIDSSLPDIIAEIILLYYSSDKSNMSDLINEITIKNPLEYSVNTNHPFYSYKIKRFLSDIALGMMPSKVWTGELDATGGSLIVRSDGEVLCYHIYNRNDFEDYLLNNTKLETASSTRHDFGTVYLENEKQYFKLNLQIRFLK